MIPDQLPVLATGSHKRGSGKACVMNAISYLNGDTVITDMPSCAHPVLAQMAQQVNDNICQHRSGDLLCSDCSHQMWMLGARIMGTASVVEGWTEHEKRVLSVRLAVWCARQVLHLVRHQDRAVCEQAIVAAEGWCEGRVTANAAYAYADAAYAAYADAAYAAYAAAYAAYDAAYAAAYAAYDAAYAAAYAYAAYADAAYAAAAYADAAYAGVDLAHGLLDEYERLTGGRGREFSAEDYEVVVREARLPIQA